MSIRMPLPEHAPAARPISGNTVMSWHWLVTREVCVPSPWLPPCQSPEIAPVAASAKMRGRLTMRAFSGAASGTWMTSMLKSAVLGSSFGILAGALGELLRRTHRARSRSVEVHVGRVVRIHHERVGMRPAARLHGRQLPRLPHVADVEDADAAESFRADGGLHAPGAAVEPAARLLDRHEEQVAVNGHVTLPARAHDRREQARRPAVLDVVGVEAVVVADEDVVVLERQVRVREAQRVRRHGVEGRGPSGARGRRGAVGRGSGVVRGRLRRPLTGSRPARAEWACRPAPWGRRSPRAWAGWPRAPCCGPPARRRAVRPSGPPGDRSPGAAARPRPSTRTTRRPRRRRRWISSLKLLEHGAHAFDLHPLIGIDIGREREDLRFLTRPSDGEQIPHHRQGAFVMLDHAFEKEAIELVPLAFARRSISSPVSMPGISGAPGAWWACGSGSGLAAILQPALHHADLVRLRDVDSLRQQAHALGRAAFGHERRHLDRLRVVANHALHEPDVGGGELDTRQIDGLGDRRWRGSAGPGPPAGGSPARPHQPRCGRTPRRRLRAAGQRAGGSSVHCTQRRAAAEGGGLLVPQRQDRIDAAGPVRGNQARSR